MGRGKKKKTPEQLYQEKLNRELIERMEAAEEHPSGKWEQGDQGFTVKATDDPKAKDGYFISIRDDEAKDHSTAVYNSDDTFADTKANRDWRDA